MTTSLTPADRQTIGRRAFWMAVVGLVLSLIGPVIIAIGGVDGSVLIAVGIVVQAASVAFLLAGVIAAIIALTRGARPVTRPVLALVALPLSGLLIFIEVFIIFLATT